MSARVGADIESLCGKCGDVWHIVVAMRGDEVAKVQCKQCGGVHRLRPPGGAEPKRRAQAADRASPKTKKKRTPAAKVEAAPDRPARKYSPRETFAVGDTILHKRFGTGVVQDVRDAGRMEVHFPDGPRLLVHDR